MWAYTTFMVITGVLSVLLAASNVATLVIWVTFGLGFPLLLVQSVFAYGLCLFPLIAWRNNAPTLGAVVSVCAIAALAFLPSQFAKGYANQIVEEVTADDFRPERPVSFRSLEIRREPDNYDNLFADNEPCGLECRSLLLTGKVDWVRVVMRTGKRARRGVPEETRSTFYRPGTVFDCAAPGASSEARHQGCVLMSADPGSLADLVVSFEEGRSKDLKSTAESAFHRFTKWRRVEASVRQNGRLSPVYRQTDAEMNLAFMPSVIAPEFRGINSSGFSIQKSKTRLRPITLDAALKAVGSDVANVPGADPKENKPTSWKDGITPALTRDALSVLDLPGVEPFNAEQEKVISKWLMHARATKDWSPEIMGILRRIVRDPRVRNASFFGQIFERNVEVTRALLPDVLDRMEAEEFGSDNTAARQAAYSFVRIDPQLLAPYRDRIIALARKGGRTGDIAMQAVGRLGVDPLPHLLPFEADFNAFRNFPRVSGACYAEMKWAPRLIAELRAALEFEPAPDRKMQARQEQFRNRVLAALANLGDVDFVRSRLKPGEDGKPSRLERQLDRLRGGGRDANRLCSF